MQAASMGAFRKLCQILKHCGLVETPTKACEPRVRMVFLGIMIDTNQMVLEVSPDRLQERDWVERVSITKKETQSLVGVLNFVAICVKPARTFMSRILNFLRSCPELGECLIPDELRADIRWWLTFLPYYNGRDWSDLHDMIACDACLTGAGGWYQGQYFHATFPSYIQNLGVADTNQS